MTFKGLEPWRKNLYIIWAAQFIAMMGMSLVVPFLPFYIRSLGVTDTAETARWSGLVFAGPFFPAFFLTPVWGYLGDRYGRKLMTVRAIFGLALSQILIGFAPNVEMLFVFRMIQGAISGFLASALALVSANTPREKSGYAIGLLQTATSSGNVIGPLVGGSLADAFGYRPIFFIVGGLCTITGIIVMKFIKETVRHLDYEPPQHSLLSNYSYALGSRPIRAALGIILLSQVAVFLAQPIFALFVDSLISDERYVATAAGAIFSVAGLFTVISAPWWGKRNDAKNYKKNLSLALFGAGIAYALQGAVISAYQLIFIRAILGFCIGGMLPVLYSYVNKNTSLERRGGVMGIAASMNILANLLGAPLGGLLGANLGFRTVFFVTGSVLASTVFIVKRYFIDLRLDSAPLAEAEHEQDETTAIEEAL
ncbi:MAG: MFS transporter [Ignavibacteriales bacterium]|nr:MFS transporter [Ignavibacteriales bacterium]